MAKEKKSAKAGRNSGSNSAKSYIASGRRMVNKLKRIKKHIKRNPNCAQSPKLLSNMSSLFGEETKRGHPLLKKAHDKAQGLYVA